MKYGIKRLTLNSPELIEITESEYLDVKAAKANLVEVLFIEQKFDLITENYFEYELALLAISTHHMIFSMIDTSQFSKDSALINRRIANLLSACRLYLDSTMRHVAEMSNGNPLYAETIEKEKSRQYDTYLGYKTMEALRNHVQHYGFPIHLVRHSSEYDQPNDRILHTFTPSILVEELEKDRKFKDAALAELKSRGPEIDVKPLVREYIQGLFNVQNKIRELIRSDISTWEKTFVKPIEIFRQQYGQDVFVLGLAVVAQSDDKSNYESESILIDFLERRRELESKNGNPGRIAASYVSSEIYNNHK